MVGTVNIASLDPKKLKRGDRDPGRQERKDSGVAGAGAAERDVTSEPIHVPPPRYEFKDAEGKKNELPLREARTRQQRQRNYC